MPHTHFQLARLHRTVSRSPFVMGSVVICLLFAAGCGDAKTSSKTSGQRAAVRNPQQQAAQDSQRKQRGPAPSAVRSSTSVPFPKTLPGQSNAPRPQTSASSDDPRKDASGPIFKTDNSGGIQRRAISDSWVLDHNSEYKRGGPDPILAKLKAGLSKVRDVRQPGQIEVPVDTDSDGRPNVWIYFEKDRPVFLEMDRFQTGCRDFRIDLRTNGVDERYGWETSPPLPLNSPVPEFAVAELFDWASSTSTGLARPTRYTRLAESLYPDLETELAKLAARQRAGKVSQQLANLSKQARSLLPRFLKVHSEKNYRQTLVKPWGHQEQHTGYDLNGDGDDHLEIFVGYSPSGVERIQFYENDWRAADGFLASVEFDGPAIESIHLGDDRYFRIGKYWVRSHLNSRQLLAERFLVPGYREWRADRWYQAAAFWKRGTQLAALLGELPIDSKGQPRAELNRWTRGTGLTDPSREWAFNINQLPAGPLLTLAAHLAWLRQSELTGSLRKLAEAAVSQHEYFEAIARYRLLLRFSRKLEKSTTIVNTLDSMSELFRHVGNYDQALHCLEESLEIESSLDYAKDIVENVKVLASDASNPESLRMTMEMRSHAMTLNRGCKLGIIAALHADLGNREKAEGFLAESRRLIQSANERYCEADLLNLQASWDIADERWEIAQQRLQRAMEIIDEAMQDQSEHDRGGKLLGAGQAMHTFIVPGKRTFLEVGMRSRTSPQAYRALSAHYLAELMLQKSQQPALAQAQRDQMLDAATKWQQQALDWYEAGKDSAGQLIGRLHLAKILTHRKDYAAARQLNQTIAQEARELHAFEVIWQSLALEGVIQSEQGNLKEAITAFERAVSEVETVRAGIRSEAVRRGFFSSKLEVYEHLIDLYDRQRQNQPATARGQWDLKIWQTMERAKARTLLDIVAGESLNVRGESVKTALSKNPRLVSQLHGGGDLLLRGSLTDEQVREQFLKELSEQPELQELASLTTVQPVSLKTLQTELQDGEVLLEYFLTKHDLFAASVTNRQLGIHRIKGQGRAQIQKDVESFRQVLEQLDPQFAAPAQLLYRRLLEPLLSQIPNAKQLCIVPAGPLHYLPFDSFLMPTGEFIAEKYRVSYAPSASALIYAFQRQPQPQGNAGALVVAEPAPRLDYGSLPGALIEGERIRDLASEPKTFLNGLNATETRVLSSLKSSRFFHFAGHTDLPPGGPMRAALLCTQDVDRDGRLEVRELFELDLDQCEVAVLSACETRLGRYSQGDEIIGLERAFLRAGVPTVVASLWKVDDAATSILMEEFYTNLWQKSLSRGEALSEAQRAILTNSELLKKRRQDLSTTLAQRGKRGLASPTPKPVPVSSETPNKPARQLVHPGYWAAFVLSGNWR